MEAVTYSTLSSQETLRDPVAFYARLREREPLTTFMLGPMKIWVIATTYEETVSLMKDPRLVKDGRSVYQEGEAPEPLQQYMQQYGETLRLLTQNMLSADPPDHTRLRSLVSKAFTPRMIEQWHPRIQQITDELLDAVQGRGQMDLVADFAAPLPMTVISEMLGIPVEERAQFRTLTQALLHDLVIPGQESQAMAAGGTFIASIRKLLVAKREQPGDDLISGLLQVEEQGDRLSEDELVSMIWLLIVAGHETTVNLLSNGALALLQHPDQIRLLQQDPGLIPAAVEELLRFTAPVVFAGGRMAREDIPFHGQVIRKGEIVYISSVAADTDPQEFSDPEMLDITRQENRHIAFGKGIHSCLGAPLARLEGQIAFSTLLRRLPNLRLGCEPESLVWNSIHNLRSLKSLPVTF
ncbi:MAG: cytochrome P450 [Ktedonobacteraceae bacterium]|nr:cytochrome P450 [Ktedonobacteraceae bacterium]